MTTNTQCRRTDLLSKQFGSKFFYSSIPDFVRRNNIMCAQLYLAITNSRNLSNNQKHLVFNLIDSSHHRQRQNGAILIYKK
jgi:hypothetical protein